MSSSSGYSQGTAAGATVNFAAPKTREEEIMAEVIKDSSWKCPSCQCANSGTFTCQNCGAPVADESLLTIARNIAKAKMMMENAEAKQGNAAGMQENAPQSWQCPFCGSQNSGKFCENCGAGKPEARPGACPGCGYVIPGGAPVPRFCPNCGAPLSDRS